MEISPIRPSHPVKIKRLKIHKCCKCGGGKYDSAMKIAVEELDRRFAYLNNSIHTIESVVIEIQKSRRTLEYLKIEIAKTEENHEKKSQKKK